MTKLSQRFEAWVLCLAALATAAVLRNDISEYVADNRFEQYWNPGRRLARSFALWDPSRGIGRVREDFWPGATMPIGLFRLLGASPAVAEHLWHGTLLTVAGSGMVALLARYRPVLGLEHALAALLYMFGPYAVTFLVPSNLFYHYAMMPWLAVVAHRGVHADRPWRSAAAFALLVFLAGNLDSPGLVFGGLAVVLVLAHEVAIERRLTARSVAAWLARAGILCVLVSAAAVVKTAVGADAFSQRLESTETPEAIASVSSWSESARGLGFWLSYFRDSVGPVRLEGAPYFTNPALVLLTFVPVVIGLGSLRWAQHWRQRTLFLGLLLVGTLLMVGGHPTGSPEPWGRFWFWAMRELPGVGTLRTTYKAGSLASLGLSALFGLGVVSAARVLGTDRLRRVSVLGGGFAVVAAVAAPVWTGGLYSPERRLDDVPAYWTDAMDWLDAQPGDGQVLLLPGATRAVYRWGWPGDDIHDALMDRAHLTDAAVSLGRPLVADVLEAIDDSAVDGPDATRSIAPVLRRLGVEYVVLRNDLDWRRMGVPRPAQYSQLRADPDLEVVATFGRRGQNVGAGEGVAASIESRLPPVEVLAVRGGVQRARADALGPWTLLSGSGAGWIDMASAGLLRDGVPIVPTALLGQAELSGALVRGSSLVVTDSNRRRAIGLTAYTGDRSRLLAPLEDLGRDIPDLYRRPGSQTVAAFGDADQIDEPGVFRSLGGFRPELRPSQAFDGDLRTGWVVGAQPDPRTRSLHVAFTRATVIDRVSIVAFDPRDPARSASPRSSFSGVPRIGRAALVFSDGTTEPLNMITGRVDVEFPPHRTTSLELRILDTTERGSLGIAEVAFPAGGLDLAEYVRLPDDAARLAELDPELRQRLATAATTYLMERERGRGNVPEEGQLRREMRSVGDRSYELTGVVSWDGAARPPRAVVGCVDIGLVVDGAPVPVRVATLADGTSSTFATCAPLVLTDGWHRLAGTGPATLDRVRLTAPGPVRSPADSTTSVEVRRTGTSSHQLEVTAPEGALLLPGDGYDARWRARAGGVDLGSPIPADAQNAWVVPAGTVVAQSVKVDFAPAGTFRLALAISSAAVALCAALVIWPRRPV